MLAHRASEEGFYLVDRLAGKEAHLCPEAIPSVVYTAPEIAWTGRSEEAAKQDGIDVLTGKYLFRPNGRAKAMNQIDGMVRIVAAKDSGKILGVQIVGAMASELIGQGVLAIASGLHLKDLAYGIQAHPTLSEILKEAALDALGEPLHA